MSRLQTVRPLYNLITSKHEGSKLWALDAQEFVPKHHKLFKQKIGCHLNRALVPVT
jgi:hypothetical protein